MSDLRGVFVYMHIDSYVCRFPKFQQLSCCYCYYC